MPCPGCGAIAARIAADGLATNEPCSVHILTPSDRPSWRGYEAPTRGRHESFAIGDSATQKTPPNVPHQPVEVSQHQCEHIIHLILEALNARNFSLDYWNTIAPNIIVEWGILHQSSILDPNEQNEATLLNLTEWLDSLKGFASACPNYHFHIWNVGTIVDEQGATAETIVNVELSGIFPGIVRQSVARFCFEWTDGGRSPTRHVAMPGVDSTGT